MTVNKKEKKRGTIQSTEIFLFKENINKTFFSDTLKGYTNINIIFITYLIENFE